MTLNNLKEEPVSIKEVSVDVGNYLAKALANFTGVLFLSPESGYIIACDIDNRAQILKSKIRNRK